jgi:hypothetical protein
MSTEETTASSVPETIPGAARVGKRRRFVRLGTWLIAAAVTAAGFTVYAVDWFRDQADRAQ